MAALLTARGRPYCDCCRYSLEGLCPTGFCPECGEPYWVNAAFYAPTLTLRLQEWSRFRLLRLWEERPSLRSVSITAFILCVSAICLGTGWEALNRFWTGSVVGKLVATGTAPPVPGLGK